MMDRRGFLKALGIGAAAVACDGAGTLGAAEPGGRDALRGRVELSNGWLFQPDPWGEGERRGYQAAAFDDWLWRKITVPQGFDRCVPGLESYEGQGWYRCALRAPADWEGRRVVLRFEGVNYRCRSWLNGELLGENVDGFLPFEFPVHGRLRFGQNNTLAVLVDNSRRQGEVPGIQRGWRNIGGILREVSLCATDKRWIDDVGIVAEPDGRLAVQVRLGQRTTGCAGGDGEGRGGGC